MKVLNWCSLAFLLLVGCGHKTVDPAAARKVSDQFMSDLIAHRADEAFDKMDVDFRDQKRTIKDSGLWYGRVAASNRLDV